MELDPNFCRCMHVWVKKIALLASYVIVCMHVCIAMCAGALGRLGGAKRRTKKARNNKGGTEIMLKTAQSGLWSFPLEKS